MDAPIQLLGQGNTAGALFSGYPEKVEMKEERGYKMCIRDRSTTAMKAGEEISTRNVRSAKEAFRDVRISAASGFITGAFLSLIHI